MLNLATQDNLKDVYKILYTYKNIFPHVRNDFVKHMIDSQSVIYDSGVVIIFKKYKRRTRIGNYIANKDDWVIKQIANQSLGNGNASKVISAFIDENKHVVLSVRKNNERAIAFYKKNGFRVVGTVTWRNDIDGLVMRTDVNFPSSSTHDVKVWPIMKDLASDNDLFWNIGK